jgi:hypothetical protein
MPQNSCCEADSASATQELFHVLCTLMVYYLIHSLCPEREESSSQRPSCYIKIHVVLLLGEGKT